MSGDFIGPVKLFSEKIFDISWSNFAWRAHTNHLHNPRPASQRRSHRLSTVRWITLWLQPWGLWWRNTSSWWRSWSISTDRARSPCRSSGSTYSPPCAPWKSWPPLVKLSTCVVTVKRTALSILDVSTGVMSSFVNCHNIFFMFILNSLPFATEFWSGQTLMLAWQKPYLKSLK